jgi:hypothetical protein
MARTGLPVAAGRRSPERKKLSTRALTGRRIVFRFVGWGIGPS